MSQSTHSSNHTFFEAVFFAARLELPKSSSLKSEMSDDFFLRFGAALSFVTFFCFGAFGSK